MRGLTFAFLVLSSYCDALRLPGGTFDLSSASPTGIVDIFQQSESVLFVLTSSFAESRLTSIVRAPYLLNITALLNSTEHILGLPIQPSVYRQLRPCCGTYSTPPSKGGQLIYSLLSELSELWKSTDNPILLEPVHVRNVPFYSIDFTVVPVRSSRNLLTRTKLAVYLYQLVQNLVRINFGASRWPGRVSCNLTVVPDGLTIGKMDVAMIPITTLGSESRSTEHNVSSHSNITGTAWEIASKGNLRADGIDVHQVFMGTGTTDRNALYLFTKLLCPLFHRPRELRVTTFVPPVSIPLIPSKLSRSHLGESMLTTHTPSGRIDSRNQIL